MLRRRVIERVREQNWTAIGSDFAIVVRQPRIKWVRKMTPTLIHGCSADRARMRYPERRA